MGSDCRSRFPLVDGVPILINDRTSVFSIADYVLRRETTFPSQPGKLEQLMSDVLDHLPSISGPIGSGTHYARFVGCLLRRSAAPRVLIVGGSILGNGMEGLTGNPAFELVASDVSFGPLTALICDAHDIPFADETFDGVVVQAVLEHVVDPYRCVGEIHRVLKAEGVVYAETPFIQQVHMGRYDFMRFTHSGHRRLFREFAEIASGPVCGPGMALAWSYQYFLLSFTTSRVMRAVMRAVASMTAFYLKYFDHYLIHKPAAVDAASGYYFIGKKSDQTFTDRELVRYYKGALR
jgi:SAM-dependent methyltransferase